MAPLSMQKYNVMLLNDMADAY